MNKNVRIQTMFFFDIFVNDKPVLFKSMRAKELLAILVDRKGSFVSYSEIISLMWPEERVNETTLARARNTSRTLMNILSLNGIADIIEINGGKRRLRPELVSCDYYDILENCFPAVPNEQLKHYMRHYSWSEFRSRNY